MASGRSPDRGRWGRGHAAILDAAPALQQGRYRRIRDLGLGGMGRVIQVHDTRLDVLRAIKLLDPGLGAVPSIRRRFEAEARTMARLSHPNIVAVHDVGVEQDQAFIVMEFVDGGSLHDRLRLGGPLAPRLACEVMSAVLAGLQHAHAAGVVHRDVKPHNVMLTKAGVAKVADFGIARVPADSAMTRTGAVIGTPAYMAPEQKSDAKRVGPQADVYAAGATLYALLTGDDPDDLYAPERQHEVRGKVPGVLAEVIVRATRYRADDRFADAESLRRALLEAAAGLPADPSDAPPLVVEVVPEVEHRSEEATLGPGRVTLTGSMIDERAVTQHHPSPTLTPSHPGDRTGAVAATPAGDGAATASDRPTAVVAERIRRPARVALVIALGLGALALVAIALGIAVLQPWRGASPVAIAEPPVEAPPVVAEPHHVTEPGIAEPTGGHEPAPAVGRAPRPVVTSKPTDTERDRTAVVVTTAEPRPIESGTDTVEPAAVATEKTASIRLGSRPSARVLLDGEVLSESAFEGQLPLGQHTVVFEDATGRRSPPRNFLVVDGKNTGMCWDFDKEAACIW